MKIYYKENKFEYFLTILFFLLPIALVFSRAVMEIVTFFICVSFIYSSFNKKKFYFYYKSSFFKLFFLFYIYLIITSFFSENFLHSIKNSFFYARFGILTLSVWYLLDYFDKFKKYFFYSVCIIIIFLFLGSLLQVFYLQDNLHYKINYDINRISGFFGGRLVQGSFLLRLFPIILGIYFSKRFKSLNYKYFLVIIFISISLIIFSGERSAIVLMLISLTILFFFSKLNYKQKLYLFLCFIFLAIFSLSISGGLKKRIFNDTVQSLMPDGKVRIFSQGHQEHYTSAIKMFLQNPIIGKGVVNFYLECQKEEYRKIGPNSCTTHPHNTYIQLLAETGIIGFTFVIGVLIYFVGIIIYNIKNLFLNKNINFALICYCTCILVNLFPLVPTGNFFNNWLSTLYFLPLGFYLHEKYKK
jgi:O-antigen ligase